MGELTEKIKTELEKIGVNEVLLKKILKIGGLVIIVYLVWKYFTKEEK